MTASDPALTDTQRRHQNRSARLGLGMLSAYGAGALVADTANFGLNTLLLFYLTVVCGMSGAAAGAVLGVALIVDAMIDPLVGSLSDNTRSRLGRRHPYMMVSAVPIFAAFVMLFTVPRGLTGGALFAYALASLLVVRIGMSGFAVPYIALGAELSDNYAERSRIVAARLLFTVLAGVQAAVLAYGVFLKGPGGQLHREAYGPFAWSCGALIFFSAAVSTIGTLPARNRLHPAPTKVGDGLLTEIREVLRNPSFRILFSACLILFVAVGVAGALTLHANTYFWKLPSSAMLAVSLASMLGLLIGVLATGLLAGRVDKRAITTGGLILIGLGQVAPVTLKLSGLLAGDAATAVLITAATISGLGSGGALVCFQSMMADAADEHEHLFGARREGLYFAGISFSAKASSGVGALISGLVLQLVGFPSGGGLPDTAAGVPAGAATSLGLIYGPGAAILTCVSIIVLSRYRRGAADHSEVQAALAKRRLGK